MRNKIKQQFVPVILYAATCFYFSYAVAGSADTSSSNEQKNKTIQTTKTLSNIDQTIDAQKKTIALTRSKRSGLNKRLKKDELIIANAAKVVNKTTHHLTKIKNKIKQLFQQKNELIVQKYQQQKLLAQQLRAAYTNGDHDYLKLILNQENPAVVQRTLSYYQYFNKARITEIKQFEKTVQALAAIAAEQQIQVDKLTQLKQQQVTQQIVLQQSNKARKITLKKLSKQLLTKEQRLHKLEREQQNLQIALRKLKQLAKAELTLTGLKHFKHKLSWPIKGRVLHHFGSRKQGYLRWKGVLLSASLGKEIKSIHNGKVLFSNWLNGYGLVIVVDHGNGYMSLYGHNQALLKNVGDHVESGEPIALVGQSGGQNRSALYFEIRHDGKAVNPQIWCH